MDRRLGGDDAAGLGTAVGLAGLGVLLDPVDTLDQDTVLTGEGRDDLALLALVLTGDDLDQVALLIFMLTAPPEPAR